MCVTNVFSFKHCSVLPDFYLYICLHALLLSLTVLISASLHLLFFITSPHICFYNFAIFVLSMIAVAPSRETRTEIPDVKGRISRLQAAIKTKQCLETLTETTLGVTVATKRTPEIAPKPVIKSLTRSVAAGTMSSVGEMNKMQEVEHHLSSANKPTNTEVFEILLRGR